MERERTRKHPHLAWDVAPPSAFEHIASAVGTFGRVLECWDRQTKEYVAIKVVRSIRKYRDATMLEIDVLQQLAKNDRGSSWYGGYGAK
ncbi:hypothetical protein JHK87_034268 [Glycine soja]|nr:hypothetical protein JHK87_034268 [Glycine soja]